MKAKEIANKIRYLEMKRGALWCDIEEIVKSVVEDYHFLDFRVSTFWTCEKSPVGREGGTMRWWAEMMSGRTEKRSYTESVISSRLLYQTGKAVDADGIAAVEFCAGLIGRSLAVAEVSGNSIADSITPAFLQSVGRALVRRGEIVFAITIAGCN